ncbi:hypothetical protein ACOSQ4_002858 [Xanthoceras sorbifolium]
MAARENEHTLYAVTTRSAFKYQGDRENNEGNKEVGGAGSFDSDRGVEVVSLEVEGKSEEKREDPVMVEGPTSVKERVIEKPILHLNSHDLLVGENGGDTICEPDPIGEVMKVLFGKETVMDSNSLCSKMDGLDRCVLRDTGQGVKGKGQVPGDQCSVCHKLTTGVRLVVLKAENGREWQGHRVQRLTGGRIHL